MKDISERHKADKILGDKAIHRAISKDSSFTEKLAALGVAGVMKAKVKAGMGLKRSKKPSFRQVLKKTADVLRRSKSSDLLTNARIALATIKQKPKKPRIIPIPKTGGFLPLIPIFAALSALGALGGGAAGIVKAVNDSKNAKKNLQEAQRHNKSMEAIALGKGLHLKPYKSGLGLYLKPYSKNY